MTAAKGFGTTEFQHVGRRAILVKKEKKKREELRRCLASTLQNNLRMSKGGKRKDKKL